MLGFATEVGGKSSHTAILAGALELPAVVGVGSFLSDVSGGESIIIDGNQGIVIIDPDEETLGSYRDAEQKMRSAAVKLSSLGPLRSETQDGVADPHLRKHRISGRSRALRRAGGRGNRPVPHRVSVSGKRSGADRRSPVRRLCTRVLKAFPTGPVVIRTLDLGAEKFPQSMQEVIEATPNPALGLAVAAADPAQSADVQDAASGHSAGGDRWATCGSCFRWFPRCWNCGRPR